jgi:GNAT superfamily N-acetyltransferase
MQWSSLWQQYLAPTVESGAPGFYLRAPTPEVVARTFDRLIDPAQQPHALVAVQTGRLVGLVHYLFHPSTWSQTPVCYMEDLFVEPVMRRAGVGHALIRALYAAADEADASAVYWVTHGSNTAARTLFDTLAHPTAFVRYER